MIARLSATGQWVDPQEACQSSSQDARLRHLGLIKDLEDLGIERVVNAGLLVVDEETCFPVVARGVDLNSQGAADSAQ